MNNSPAWVPSADAAADSTAPRLSGRWLLVVRMAWMAIYLLVLVWLALTVVSQLGFLLHPCTQPGCLLTPAQGEILGRAGISLGAFAAYFIGISLAVDVAGVVMALLLFWRRSDDWMALVVGLFLLWPISSFASGPAGPQPPLIWLPVFAIIEIVFYAVFLIFPDGRFVPRWAWLLLLLWIVLHVLLGLNDYLGLQGPTFILSLYPILYLSAVGIQIYRLRQVSTPRQRQQTKWVVVGVSVALVGNVLYWIVLPYVPLFAQAGSFYFTAAFPVWQLASLALPVSFAIAIQRHQLFDIDVLINRVLVYGSLSLILALLYFGIVIGAQILGGRLTGETSVPAWVIVITTLLVAGLFNPLRHRLQLAINRRFYRTRYDADRALQRLAASLRTETDLQELSEQLLAIVQEAMQPVSLSLWLRESEKTPLDQRTVGSA